MGTTNSSNNHEDGQSQQSQDGRITATPNSVEAAAFVQSIFLQNEELAFIPLRMMSDGHRELNKAKTNQTKAVDLPFELNLSSVTLKPSQEGLSKWNLQFFVDTKVVSKVIVYVGAKEERADNKYNTVLSITSEQQIEVSLPEKQDKQLVTAGINIDSLQSQAEKCLDLLENSYPILITLVNLQSKGQSREVRQAYYYFKVQTGHESCSMVCLKKGTVCIKQASTWGNASFGSRTYSATKRAKRRARMLRLCVRCASHTRSMCSYCPADTSVSASSAPKSSNAGIKSSL